MTDMILLVVQRGDVGMATRLAQEFEGRADCRVIEDRRRGRDRRNREQFAAMEHDRRRVCGRTPYGKRIYGEQRVGKGPFRFTGVMIDREEP